MVDRLSKKNYRKRIIVQVFVAITIFVSGAIVGSGGTICLLKNKGILRPPRFSSLEISKKIGAKYSLAEAQIEQVEQIFEKADQSLRALRHDLEGKMEAASQQIVAEMKLVLSSEQFEPWKIEFEARHKRHMEKHNQESKNIK